MRMARRFLPVIVLFFCLHRLAIGQQPLHWESTIDSAKATAGQSNRLVLVFFCASYCGPCHRMENELRNQPGAVSALEANFVPVKINIEYYPNTAKQYGVTRVPTTVIVAPNARGEVLALIPEYMSVDQYLSKLNKLAANAKRPGAGVLAQIQAGPPSRAAAPTGQSPLTGPSPTAGSAPVNPQPTVQVAAIDLKKPAETGKRPANPLLGLDGFCPVQLVENSRWQPGKKAWGAIHRGRTYLFAGEEEQHRFLAHPDRYAPVSSGDDVVLLLEQGRSVSGYREHGLRFDGHVYLFANESTLGRFQSNPRYYAQRALQAIQSASQTTAVR